MAIEVTRRNKRAEQISSALMNLGTALVAATAVRLFDQVAFDPTSLLWSGIAAALIWVGMKTLDLLEEEW